MTAPPPIGHDELDRIAALDALGLASPEEQRVLLAAGAEGARLRQGYADAAAALALALPEVTPPPFASIAARLPAAERPSEPRTPATVRRRPQPLAWLAAGAAVAAAAALGLGWQRARADAVTARRELEVARAGNAVAVASVEATCRRDAELVRARLAAVQSPRLELATMHGAAGGTVKVFVDPQQRRWLVLAFELPAVADKEYQLWFVPDGGAPVSAGLLTPGPDGVLGATPVVPVGLGAVRPAISLEPRGGSPAPTDVKLVGEPI